MDQSCFSKAFFCFSRQDYYGITPLPPQTIDMVIFGNFSAKGLGYEYEIMMEWIELGGRISPRLCMFSESFRALTEHAELFKELVSLHDTDFTPEEFSKLLLRLGYRDYSDKALIDALP